ncbi:MAG: hypothetical protein AB7U35_00355 [Sphingobium sp.]
MTITPLGMVIALLVVAVLIGAVVTYMRHRHSAELRSRYGSEYDNAVREAGGTYKGETLLHEREKRVARFRIIPLSERRRAEFVTTWQDVQARFVDDPAGAVARADVLLGEVMRERGYPVTDFEQRSADLSVDHPEVVQNYRAGHDIALRHGRGEASTEELRQAMIHYRALFDDLVNEPVDGEQHERVANLKKEKIRD